MRKCAIVRKTKLKHFMNSMLTIQIYKHDGLWCFTDDSRDLLHEPFVLGMSEIITHVIKLFNIGSEQDYFRITFSSNKFPQHQGKLYYQYSEYDGAWYCLNTIKDENPNENDLKGWLCPATLKFFEIFPKSIYFKVELV